MRRLLLIATILGATTIHSRPADAVIVECANCSTVWQQLLDSATQAKQLAQQALQYKTQLDQYANQIINTTALPQSIWSDVMSNINQVRNLANAASLLTGNSGSILSRLQSARGYADQVSFLPQNIGSQFAMWQQTIGNSNNSLGRTLATQQAQEQAYASQQASINLQSQNAVGQLQAIQAGNQLASLTATQLNQMQVTLTAAAQEQATRDMVAADRQATDDAVLQQTMSYQALSMTGSRGF